MTTIMALCVSSVSSELHDSSWPISELLARITMSMEASFGR
jgi:hypothetical protein